MAMINELESTDNPHNNNELRIQHAQEFCDYAARIRSRYWILVGQGPENTWSHDKLEADDPNSNREKK